MRPGFFKTLIAAAAAGAGGVAPANYVVTNSAQLESAATSATSGQIVEIAADISVVPNGARRLNFVPGVTIRTDSGNTRTVTGYAWRVYANGNYTLTTFAKGLVIDGTGVNSSSTYLGTVELAMGKFQFNAKVVGVNGGTSGNRPGNLVSAIATATLRCELDLDEAEVYNGGADLVAGYAGYGDATAASGSYIRAKRCLLHKPGTGGSDNAFTVHDGFKGYAEGGKLYEQGGGPLVNSAPQTSTMELYGVEIDMTGATTSTQDMHVTVLSGCKITGLTTGARMIYIHSDGSVPSSASLACFNQSCASIVAAVDNAVPPIFYRNTQTTDDSFMGHVPTTTTYTVGLVTARNVVPGRINNAYGSMMYRSASQSYNDEINVPATAVSASFPIRTDTASGSATFAVQVYNALLNGSQRALCNYATRSDAANTSITITRSVTKAVTAIGFGAFTNVSSTLDGSNPSSYPVGAANACAELQALPWYVGAEAYLATAPAVGTYGWSAGLKTAMGV